MTSIGAVGNSNGEENSHEAQNPDDCWKMCTTPIGLGDHEITAVVSLHQMNGPTFDFAKVVFLCGNTPMSIVGTTSSRIYLDDVEREREAILVSGEADSCRQTLHVKLSYSPPTDRTMGVVVADCLCLTDRFGRAPQRIQQVIALWHERIVECRPIFTVPRGCPYLLGCDYKIETTIEQTRAGDMFYLAKIDFYFRANDSYLVQDYKLGKRPKDSIFLTPQRRIERDLTFYSSWDNTPEGCRMRIVICSINVTLPREDAYGYICIDGYYLENNNWNPMENLKVAEWDPKGDSCW